MMYLFLQYFKYVDVSINSHITVFAVLRPADPRPQADRAEVRVGGECGGPGVVRGAAVVEIVVRGVHHKREHFQRPRRLLFCSTQAQISRQSIACIFTTKARKFILYYYYYYHYLYYYMIPGPSM